ncbi:hypothetical protein EUX98_g4242 [Antrodiella citrinella]|uniref:FK506-binding protein n=1 Tax=Antrodiella citrinella TaxID=2447956 RepID=A0A4S4MUH7_9APHY|nr:hypothetical protein EUX98_g4242 [Antrodiella citrinella]
MATAVAIWSLKLEPGETQAVVPLSDLRVTNVALGESLVDENGRTSVKLVYIGPSGDESDDEEEGEEDDEAEDKPGSEEPISTILCSLTPGKIEQSMVNIILEGDQEYLFESVGKNAVYLTGNYIGMSNFLRPTTRSTQRLPQISPTATSLPTDSDDSDDDSDDAYDLPMRKLRRSTSLTSYKATTKHGLCLDRRFEEVDDDDLTVALVPNDSKKRSRESDDAEDGEPKLSKKEKKKQKKLKAENGEAIPTGEDSAEPKAEKKKDKKEKKEDKAKKPQLADPKVLAGGVKIADNKTGSGPAAKAGDRVSVRYVGKLQNGSIFDSNTKGKPFQFRLGRGEVIKGWDAGVAGMQAGGERLITVPPAQAYGNKKQNGIPANSTLIFEVKVVQIN